MDVHCGGKIVKHVAAAAGDADVVTAGVVVLTIELTLLEGDDTVLDCAEQLKAMNTQEHILTPVWPVNLTNAHACTRACWLLLRGNRVRSTSQSNASESRVAAPESHSAAQAGNGVRSLRQKLLV